MYRTSVASQAESAEVLAFLERRGILQNAWLIGDVFDVLRLPDARRRVVICREGSGVSGVISVCRHGCPAPGAPTYPARIDATNRASLELLLQDLPNDEVGSFGIVHPIVQHYFNHLEDALRRPGDLYYTVSSRRLRPVRGEATQELTAADARLFDGCERQRDWHSMGAEHRVFAIMRGGRAVTSTAVCPITPAGRGRRVIAISGLYTETPHRRKGLGVRLVSLVTEMILRAGDVPMYWTEHENAASRGLAEALGYWRYGQQVCYQWRKPANLRTVR